MKPGGGGRWAGIPAPVRRTPSFRARQRRSRLLGINGAGRQTESDVTNVTELPPLFVGLSSRSAVIMATRLKRFEPLKQNSSLHAYAVSSASEEDASAFTRQHTSSLPKLNPGAGRPTFLGYLGRCGSQGVGMEGKGLGRHVAVVFWRLDVVWPPPVQAAT
jgi:hypothetical protein